MTKTVLILSNSLHGQSLAAEEIAKELNADVKVVDDEELRNMSRELEKNRRWEEYEKVHNEAYGTVEKNDSVLIQKKINEWVGEWDNRVPTQEFLTRKLDVPQGYKEVDKKLNTFMVRRWKIITTDRKTALKKYTILNMRGHHLLKEMKKLLKDQYSVWYWNLMEDLAMNNIEDMDYVNRIVESCITRLKPE